ncbi:maltose ABC transporter permease MalF [Endozoicomonas elysicola]|uniref:Maltose/maltodextrin transport system permease protein n=1 Tax=Endozoicomonas elysicola TaxID=305900 RepID=A0A081K907_9GAMM|nr:maltose ABC transporter permease MalF [Endozoicomonas elysicola]KEI70633.1 maltose transporter membrane protein [Endozoicomonas elysicola]
MSSSRTSIKSPSAYLVIAIVALIDLVLLYGVTLMYAQGELAFAILVLILVAVGSWVFISKKGYNYRYVYPSLLGVVTFIVFPLVYTVNVAFTNYSSNHLLSLERVRAIHLAKTWRTGGESFSFKMYQEGPNFRLMLSKTSTATDEHYLTEPFPETSEPLKLKAYISTHAPTGAELPLREVIKKRSTLKQLNIVLPNDTGLAMTSLRKFGAIAKVYRPDDHIDRQYPEQSYALIDNRTGETIYPDMATGYYTNSDGSEQIGPGFTIYTGWDNFTRVFTDPGIQGPFLKIFAWTIIFSALSVAFTLIIGLLMACLVQWEPLKGNGVYRLLLILPYAVPAFISILIFRGLFNQNFGEINLLLDLLFGVKPEWFSNELLAKSMVVIVNTWLGYPYMMILSIGLLKSIPDDLYEASAIDGATPVQNLFHITIPMIIKPLIPLLIASFAFNFNNLVLIALLTDGAPDMLHATTPAGATDILVSYTFRIAFGSYGQDYGLASAIATVIFLMVGFIAWVNLKATRQLQ